MKKAFILIIIVLSAAIFSNIAAQSDKDLRDTNVKGRSNELERIDRAARKENSKKKDESKDKSATVPVTPEQPKDELAAKYDEIKTDYEQIQMSQDSVIKTYQGNGKVDYAQIGKFAQEINESASRLNSNLFAAPPENPDAQKVVNPEAKNNEKKADASAPAKSIRDLIVDLDNAIGSFAASPMFQNLRTVDPAVSEKAKTDLGKIIELSAMLDAAAQKSAADEK